MKILKSLFISVLIAGSLYLSAQSQGELNPAFGDTGTAPALVNFNMLVQSDGKIIVPTPNDNNGNLYFEHFLPDGSIDSSFGSNGVTGGHTRDTYFNYVLQPDNKLLMSAQGIVRLKLDGSVDSSFGTNGYLQISLLSKNYNDLVLVLHSGKLLVLDHLYLQNTIPCGPPIDTASQDSLLFVRLNADGTIDKTYGTNGYYSAPFHYPTRYCYNMWVDANDNLTFAATAWINGGPELLSFRVNSNGTLNNNYGNNGLALAYSDFYAASAQDYGGGVIQFQNDGKILTLPNTGVIARYNTNGALDSTFGNGGVDSLIDVGGYYGYYSQIIQGFDGKIYAGGATSASILVAGLLSTGRIDSSFGNNGFFLPPPTISNYETDLYNIAIERDGSLLLNVNFDDGTTNYLLDVIGAPFDCSPQFTNDSAVICQGTSYAWHSTTGTFIDTLINVNGCDSIRTLKLIVLNSLQDTVKQTICSGQSYAGHATSGTYIDTLTASGGCDSITVLNLTVQALTSDTVSHTIAQGQNYDGYTVTGIYVDTFQGTNDCDSIRTLFLSVIPNDTVWPGDANNDGIANNYDLLAIGLAYGDIGGVRPNATNTWTGQACPEWSDIIPGGVNANHADCNGDSVVNANDTVPVLLNYGLTHPKTNPYQRTSGAPTISLVMAADSIGVSTSVNVSINLGDINIAAQNVMAIAFTINYDPTLVKDSTPVFYAIKSWLGTPDSDLIYIQKETQPGSLDVGLTRTDHAMVSGEGQIGSFGFVTIDNLSGKMFLNDTLKMNISNVEMIMNDGTILPVNTQGDSIPLFQEQTGIPGTAGHPFELDFYPNPTTGMVNYTVSGLSGKATYTIDDITGRTLLTVEIASSTGMAMGKLDLSSFAKGVYFFRMHSADGNVVRKIVLQ